MIHQNNIQVLLNLSKTRIIFSIWHRQLNGYECEQTLGDSEGQGSLACCSPWGPMAYGLNSNSMTRQ